MSGAGGNSGAGSTRRAAGSSTTQVPVPAERWTVIASPVGALTLVATAAGLCNVWFADESIPPMDPASRLDVGDGDHGVSSPAPALAAAVAQLAAYFGGESGAFSVPLDLRGTPFQQRVWSALCAIPAGSTRTYGAIATEITAERPDQPTSARAVAAAVGRTPVPIIVPCHRVIGGDGSLTGYRGGLDRKRALLQLEGAAITAAGPNSSPAKARVGVHQLPLL